MIIPSVFFRNVRLGEGACWLWCGGKTQRGYGTVYWARRDGGPGRMIGAHCLAYRIFCGEIPAGHVLDHLCRQPGCVNPWHLEPVTRSENAKRGLTGQTHAARCAIITTCKRGHLYSPKRDRRGYRVCLECRRENTAKHRKT